MAQDSKRVAVSATGGWADLIGTLQDLTASSGASAFSLGVLDGDRVMTFNGGFPSTTCATYRVISASSDLPGPEALRSGSETYLRDRAQIQARFPSAVAIHAQTPYEAAAVLLLGQGSGAVAQGYLALHFVGRRRFEGTERWRFRAAARVAGR